MTKRKAAAPSNEPIVLSGSVFLDGILAEDHPRARMPAKLNVGDIRLHNINKPGERLRFGEKVTFSGFIVANVWNGKRFRRLLLRKLGAVESTYVGPVARRERSIAVLRHLSTLVRRQTVWFADDSGYEVTQNRIAASSDATPALRDAKLASTTAVATTIAPPAVTRPVPVSPETAAVNVSVTVKVEVKGSGQTVVQATTEVHQATARKRRRRSIKADKNQQDLFPEKDQLPIAPTETINKIA
jgi:hypothetical protein